jgi:hypothetical protein
LAGNLGVDLLCGNFFKPILAVGSKQRRGKKHSQAKFGALKLLKGGSAHQRYPVTTSVIALSGALDDTRVANLNTASRNPMKPDVAIAPAQSLANDNAATDLVFSPSLPAGWTEFMSKSKGLPYWRHADGRTSWTRPSES